MVATGAADDGSVAEATLPVEPTPDVRALVPETLGGPVEKQVQDLLDGFIAGA